MKLLYLPPKKFPSWGKFNFKEAGKERYKLDNGKLYSSFEGGAVHYNHIEMSGFGASSIISYGVDKNQMLKIYRFCAFPTLRVNPNNTHGSLTVAVRGIELLAGNEKEFASRVEFDGVLKLTSKVGQFDIERKLATANEKKALIEIITIKNGGNDAAIRLSTAKMEKKVAKCFTPDKTGHCIKTQIFIGDKVSQSKQFDVDMKSGESIVVTAVYSAESITLAEARVEVDKRVKFITDSNKRLVIKTPSKYLNQMTQFCKIRASESIYSTKSGLMHSPGGGGFYGAIWTNDQCEYANPLFAYLGYDKAILQSENCYQLYSNLVSEEQALKSSITACGDGLWYGAGDRGDTSMYLYGLSRFLLTRGDRALAEKFLPYIKKAITFVKSKIREDGVVLSDSDELENRFESGGANLSTSVITYDAFISLAYLFIDLGLQEESANLKSIAKKIKDGIQSYFAREVEGYATYRYCEEEEKLRAWISLPLTVGIVERKKGTIDALLSPKLRMVNGILTRSGEKTYWDRSTLYAIKGIFIADEADKAVELLESYTKERLLGEHIPYPVEAFPEGNAAHLSAESALYLRIFVEGILGWRPTGFKTLEIKPSLPSEWNEFSIENIDLGGKLRNIRVERVKSGYNITFDGETTSVVRGEILKIKLN